ncbi:hypothetical protein BH09VER1_BH09VER1_38830 [soil metagenome]
MNWQNPRKFSWHLALGTAVAFAATIVASLCFDLGDGSFLKGVKSLGGFILIYGFGVVVMMILAGALAIVAGRIVGITLTAILAIGLLLWMGTDSWCTAQPYARFCQLIWAEAPVSLRIREVNSYPSFSDGTAYSFVIDADSPLMANLAKALSLDPISRERGYYSMLCELFADKHFPSDTQFYQGGKFMVAFIPLEHCAYVCRDRPPRSEQAQARR